MGRRIAPAERDVTSQGRPKCGLFGSGFLGLCAAVQQVQGFADVTDGHLAVAVHVGPLHRDLCHPVESVDDAQDVGLNHDSEGLERQRVLILDELGYVPFSKSGAELLFDVVSRAYERTSLIVTTNLPFEKWTEVMGSERLTGALLDRLTHRVHILEANGDSYRLQDSKRRKKGRKQK